MNRRSFQDRYGPWAVVTGASDGIGREFARELASRGLNLALVARRREALSLLRDELVARHGVSCEVLPIDLSHREGRAALARLTEGLDVGLLVAAAGFGTSGDFVDAPLEIEQDLLAVNCAAVLDLSWHFARRFAARGRGGLVLLSSIVAFQGVARSANYAATKAWVQTFAEGLRMELAGLGVDVVAVAPGPVASGFGARALMDLSGAMPASRVAGESLDSLGRRFLVRPGGLSKGLGWSLASLPRWARVRVMSGIMRSMTRRDLQAVSGEGAP